MGLPFNNFTKKDWVLWCISLLMVTVANVLSPDFDALILVTALIGVTSLILAAKGNVWSPILMVFFCFMYGVISYRFRYWGEMITYLGMTLPMAVWSAYVWFKNPSKENDSQVEIAAMTPRKWIVVVLAGLAVTVVFYYILKYFETPNIIFSTLSITTSFIAAELTVLRSSYFALVYGLNDLVLIILWILASLQNPVYIPVVVNFVIFFVNDVYGFISWKIRE